MKQNKITILADECSAIMRVFEARNKTTFKGLQHVFITKFLGNFCLIATNLRVMAGAFFSEESKGELEIKGNIKEGIYRVNKIYYSTDSTDRACVALEQIVNTSFPKKNIVEMLQNIEKHINDNRPDFFTAFIPATYQLKAFLYGKNEIVNPAVIDFLPEYTSGYDVYEMKNEASLFFIKDVVFALAMPLKWSRQNMRAIYDEYLKGKK